MDIFEVEGEQVLSEEMFHETILPEVRRSVKNILEGRTSDEIEEVISDVLFRIFSNRDILLKLDSVEKIRLYCRKATQNTSFEYLRAFEKRDSCIPLYEEGFDDPVSLSKNPWRDVEATRARELVFELFQSLTETDRQILMMYLDEKSHEEISRLMNITIVTVRKRISRAIRNLKLAYRDATLS